MPNSFKIIVFAFLVAISTERCSTRVYSDERLAIDPKFLLLFNTIIQKDTIRFSSSSGRIKTFAITEVDSVISNRKALIINAKPYKALRVYFREIGTDTILLERSNEIEVVKDPQSLASGVTIHFNNLYFSDTVLLLLRDTLNLNTKKFTNYYSFETSLRLKKQDDANVLYINVPKGFLGFKMLSGEVWVIDEMK